MKRCLGLAALLLLAGGSLTPVAAQEVQVPLDRDGRVLEIDRSLARELGLLLDEYPRLRVARLFETDDGAFVLEISFERDGRLARQRVPLTAPEVDRLRARVTGALTERTPAIAPDQSGRSLLLTASTLLGLSFYGWAVPTVFDIDGERSYLAAYMLAAGVSFVGPSLYTRRRRVTYGMANAAFWGATRGISHGAFLVNALGDPGARTTTGAAMAGSLIEGVLGYRWADGTDMDAGTAHTIGNFGDFGTAVAAEIMLVTQPSSDDLVYGSILAGSAAGLALGATLGPSLDYSWGDAEIQRAAHVLGAGHGGMVYDWIYGDDAATDDEARVLGGLLLAGSLTGTWAAHRLLEDHDFSVGEGILVELGGVAGGLVGVGLGFLLGDDEIDPTPLFTLGVVGADLGLLATYWSLSDNARRRARTGSGTAGTDRLELHVDPSALVRLAVPTSPTRVAPLPAVPTLALRYRF